jgi:CRISPR system Cascade subunit CasE
VKKFMTQCLVSHETAAKERIYHHGRWHAKIWEAFRPVSGDDIPRAWLYSVEETPNGYKALILSDEIPTRPDWCPSMGWATKPLPDEFLNHSRYVFGLTANATKSGEQRISLAKRTSAEDDPEPRLLDWLERKGDRGGFQIYRSKTSVLPLSVESFPTSDGSQKMTLQYVQFRGVLEVTNKSDFQNSFNLGIGRGRAFGAGLLLLKPIQ